MYAAWLNLNAKLFNSLSKIIENARTILNMNFWKYSLVAYIIQSMILECISGDKVNCQKCTKMDFFIELKYVWFTFDEDKYISLSSKL